MNVRIEDKEQGVLLLWCLFVGGLCAERSALQREWFSIQIEKLTQRLGLQEWRVVKEALEKLWWVEGVHEPICKRLWIESASEDHVLGI